MAKAAWIFSYKNKKNVTKDGFIETTKKLHDNVISKEKGFISWEHYQHNNTWIDYVLWETYEDAMNAMKAGQGKIEARDFYNCIQLHTCRSLVSEFIKKY